METRILTKHPEKGKEGVNISRAKYDIVRAAIEACLREGGEMSFEGLGRAVEGKLAGHFEGSISWYYTTVKLDLEARHVLKLVPGSSPQRISLAK